MDLNEAFRGILRLLGLSTQQLQSLLMWFLAIALIFVPAERFWYAHKQRVARPGLRQDIALYFLGGVIPPVFSALVATACVWLALKVLPPAYFDWLRQWPIALQVVVALVLGEVTYYWAHRLAHEVPWLWRFHAIHHSPVQMDWLVNTRAHPVDLVFTHVLSAIPLLFLGLKLPAGPAVGSTLVGLVVFQTVWSFFIHSNCRLRLGPLEQLITTPAFHHWHHANDDKSVQDKNYAAVFPWMDRVFGSYHLPSDRLPASYGVDDPVPDGIRAVLWHPFKAAPRADVVAPPQNVTERL